MLSKLLRCQLILTLIGLIPVLSAQAKRPAGSKTIQAVVLPVRADGFSGKFKNQLRSTALKELRKIGVFKQVSTRFMLRKLQELKKKRIYGKECMSNPVCVRTVGGILGARVVFFLKADRSGRLVSIRIQSFDAKSGKAIRREVEKARQVSADIDKVVRWLTRKASSPMVTTMAKGKGRLQVNCKEKDAELYVNGKFFGKRTGKRFKVSSGVFDVLVKKQGFVSFRDVLVIKPGETGVVRASLEPKAGRLPAPVVAKAKPLPTPEKKEPEKKQPEQKKPAWLTDTTVPKTTPVPATTIPPMKKPPVTEKPKTVAVPKATPAAEKEKVPPWVATQQEPFLPSKEKRPIPVPARREEESKFYQSWWFWTLVGVVAAAGGGYAYYALSKEEGPSEGSALVTWP